MKMGPVPTEEAPAAVNHKKKYKALKRKLKLLVYEQECFLEELRKSQRKLLKVSRDRSFLLDRLLQHEKIDDSSSGSEGTVSSDSETEGKKDGSAKKKKVADLSMFRDPAAVLGSVPFTSILPPQVTQGPAATGADGQKKKVKVTKKIPKAGTSVLKFGKMPASSIRPIGGKPASHVTMTREELERHLEIKQSTRPQFMSIEKASYTLPDDIFSNETSNPEVGDRGKKSEMED